jgi:hypothetical protein
MDLQELAALVAVVQVQNFRVRACLRYGPGLVRGHGCRFAPHDLHAQAGAHPGADAQGGPHQKDVQGAVPGVDALLAIHREQAAGADASWPRGASLRFLDALWQSSSFRLVR